ncbi:hypothetical protein BJY01DRAFT_263039 [Aspergillus pseudoustus]|uniref:pyridoxal 5'-phosphate synthase n=1 Tax=Aspergillus pseudoustus TaxID=1810923 RepID=A0ABR4K5C4_9EURO
MTKSLRTQLRLLPTHTGPFPLPPPTPSSLPSTPTAAFQTWLHDAITAGVIEPHALTLSTVDSSTGIPDSRVLILKDLDSARGWQFAIRGDGPKAAQLDGNPGVALCFYWAELGRQVRIRGRAVRLSVEEEERDWEGRPRASKVAAAASRTQSAVLGSLEELRGSVERVISTATASDSTGREEIQRPAWRVYAVSPVVVEFWQRSSDRLHQRVRFRKAEKDDREGGEGEDGWVKELLWP